MSLYQPPEPSRLMEGVIIDVREPNSGNPRYTVDLEQTDQPYPVRVYAWAAPQSYHQAAAGQYLVGQRVLIQNISGTMSVVGIATEARDPNAPANVFAAPGAVGTDTIQVYDDAINMAGPAHRITLGSSGIDANFANRANANLYTRWHLDDLNFSFGSQLVQATNETAIGPLPGGLQTGAFIIQRTGATGGLYYTIPALPFHPPRSDEVEVHDNMNNVVGHWHLSDAFTFSTWVALHSSVMAGGAAHVAGQYPAPTIVTHYSHLGAAPQLAGVTYEVSIPSGVPRSAGDRAQFYFGQILLPHGPGGTILHDMEGFYNPGVSIPLGAPTVLSTSVPSSGNVVAQFSRTYLSGGGSIVVQPQLTGTPSGTGPLYNTSPTAKNYFFFQRSSVFASTIRFGNIPVTLQSSGLYAVSSETDITLGYDYPVSTPTPGTPPYMGLDFVRVQIFNSGGQPVTDISEPYIAGILYNYVGRAAPASFLISLP